MNMEKKPSGKGQSKGLSAFLYMNGLASPSDLLTRTMLGPGRIFLKKRELPEGYHEADEWDLSPSMFTDLNPQRGE